MYWSHDSKNDKNNNKKKRKKQENIIILIQILDFSFSIQIKPKIYKNCNKNIHKGLNNRKRCKKQTIKKKKK